LYLGSRPLLVLPTGTDKTIVFALLVQRRHGRSLALAHRDLAKLWHSQDRRQDAYALLALVYEWFTEGFDTADLQEAKTLLEELTG
jgi:predicted ATPase